jgi:hypothetical protein
MVAMGCHGIVIMPDDKCEDEEFGIAAKSTKIAKKGLPGLEGLSRNLSRRDLRTQRDNQLRRSEIFIALVTYPRSAPLGATSCGSQRSELDVAPTGAGAFLASRAIKIWLLRSWLQG